MLLPVPMRRCPRAKIVQVVDLALGLGDLLADLQGEIRQHTAGFGRLDPAAGTSQQTAVEFLLKYADLPVDCRMRDVQQLSGRGISARFDHGQK